jgi:hypothetical protein
VLILKGLHGQREPFPPGQKRELMDPPLITKGYSIRRIIKGQEKVGVQGKSGIGGMEGQENKHVTAIIRELDKETLNLYTPV